MADPVDEQTFHEVVPATNTRPYGPGSRRGVRFRGASIHINHLIDNTSRWSTCQSVDWDIPKEYPASSSYANLRRLLERGREQGALAVDLDVEGAALIIAAIKGVSLPTMASFEPARVDEVFGQLQQLLGV
ncbi:MAG: hypothetical protein KGJ86_11340 [Chloroflexota bacterium]|nr:hypothetical protein [Chloroflexota bacterium]